MLVSKVKLKKLPFFQLTKLVLGKELDYISKMDTVNLTLKMTKVKTLFTGKTDIYILNKPLNLMMLIGNLSMKQLITEELLDSSLI